MQRLIPPHALLGSESRLRVAVVPFEPAKVNPLLPAFIRHGPGLEHSLRMNNVRDIAPAAGLAIDVGREVKHRHSVNDVIVGDVLEQPHHQRRSEFYFEMAPAAKISYAISRFIEPLMKFDAQIMWPCRICGDEIDF